jgi:hypothetical protein
MEMSHLGAKWQPYAPPPKGSVMQSEVAAAWYHATCRHTHHCKESTRRDCSYCSYCLYCSYYFFCSYCTYCSACSYRKSCAEVVLTPPSLSKVFSETMGPFVKVRSLAKCGAAVFLAVMFAALLPRVDAECCGWYLIPKPIQCKCPRDVDGCKHGLEGHADVWGMHNCNLAGCNCDECDEDKLCEQAKKYMYDGRCCYDPNSQ